MEDLRITGLTLNNVGVFEHLELSFKKQPLKYKAEIHIFTGGNGTGKTTLLEAMTYFDVFYNNDREERNKGNLGYKRSVKGDNRKRNLAIGIHFDENKLDFYYSKTKATLTVFGMPKFILSYYDKYKQSMHAYNFFAYNGHRNLEETQVEAFKNFEFNPLTDALSFNKANGNTNLFQWIANTKTRSALSFQKGNISQAEEYLLAINKIENAISEITAREIRFVIDEHSLNVMVQIDSEPIHYNTLPDGYKSVISWLTDLMFRLDYIQGAGKRKFTLFLDEIDVHLHPRAQRRILPVIQKLFPEAQIFLTTHSPFVIGSVDDAWVYKFKLDEKGNSVLDGEPLLTEDGKSYRHVLEEIFDIDKQFGVEVEKQLDAFYKIRDEAIKMPSEKLINELQKASHGLAVQSVELRAIMGNELRQLSRILKTEIAL